ncbi:MAG: hypothetical protein ABSB50_18830 [Terracidiphilus sp.]|jgi:hypothetical protein
MSYPQRSIPAAVTLFFVAPLVAEYLLGDFPVTFLSPLIMLAPLYGGGALLIRELARRSGRGWPTILLLGVAYAIIEEAFAGQTLFNPDIFGMHMHLLSHAWIPALGIGAWWTLFMLNVHPFWSIGVSIALVDGLFPYRTRAPWLGKAGLSVAAALYAAGVIANTAYSLHHDPFRASHAQFLVSALFVVVFAVAAFLLPASATPPASDSTRNPSPVPSPWITGGAAFLLGAAVMLSPILWKWNWGAVAWILVADLVFLLFLWEFSRRDAWTPLHTFSVGAGGALVYGVHAFIGKPVVPSPKWAVLASHVLLLVLALAVICVGARRTSTALATAPAEPL